MGLYDNVVLCGWVLALNIIVMAVLKPAINIHITRNLNIVLKNAFLSRAVSLLRSLPELI